jgi:hypothetical protein
VFRLAFSTSSSPGELDAGPEADRIILELPGYAAPVRTCGGERVAPGFASGKRARSPSTDSDFPGGTISP